MEERLKTIAPISKLIEQGLTPEEILEELFGKEQCKGIRNNAGTIRVYLF